MWSTTSTAIKICGITRLDQALAISAMDINAIGIIGVSSSPRFIVETDRRIIFSKLTRCFPSIKRVLVLADPNNSTLSQNISGDGAPSIIQLHGNESPKRCAELRKKYPDVAWWKALRIKTQEDLQLAKSYECVVDNLLLDAWSPNELGGSGNRISPQLLNLTKIDVPWWLAGGISAEWIPEVLSRTKPYGVDASSRLEISPGIKDLKKVAQLISAIKYKP